MVDQAHLDSRYFVDETVYNCPFCNRRHVAYAVYSRVPFDWTETKPCFAFFVRCDSCGKRSMHLTFDTELSAYQIQHHGKVPAYRFSVGSERDAGETLDRAFFYSVPTSFFVLDERIPKKLRELLAEAEGCLKSNYLTGASACARKIVYELGAISGLQEGNYEERIKALKLVHPAVEPAFFDTLLTIQQATSAKVHENSYDGWEAKHLRVMLVALADVLQEIYVVPALRMARRQAIIALKEELVPTRSAGKNSDS